MMGSPMPWRIDELFDAVLYAAGEDLHRVLWLKSRSSEVWLERRTHYTRSCAVMSMVCSRLFLLLLSGPCYGVMTF